MTDVSVTTTDAGVMHDGRIRHKQPTRVSSMTEAGVIDDRRIGRDDRRRCQA